MGFVGEPSFPTRPPASTMPRPGRIGVVVPPANPTVEIELRDLLDQALVVTRFRPAPGDLRARLDSYRHQLQVRPHDFGGLRLDALYVACTGCFYEDDPADVALLASELTTRWDIPVVFPLTAIAAALAEIGSPHVALLSPYPRWLTEASERYWHQAGVELSAVAAVGSGDPYDVTPDEVVRAARTVATTDETCLLFTGTGMQSVAAMSRVRAELPNPMLSSNWAAAWQIRRLLAEQRIAGSHDATEEQR